MNQSSCSQTCSSPCAEGQHAPLPPLNLADVLLRLEREARRGVCDTGRYRMPYLVWGNGPPLILIHGVSDSSRSFYLPMARLSAHFRCIAYDLPTGSGDGARLWRYRHEHLVEDFWALLDHLNLPRAYVMGVSFGATVALRALRQNPSRLPRAALQAGVAARRLRRGAYWLSWLGRLLPGSMARVLPRREKLLTKVHREAFADRPEEVWRAFVDWTGETPVATMAHQAQWLHRLDLRPELPEIRQPVLLIWGNRDTVVPLARIEELRTGLPSSGLVVMEGVGHFPCWTHPEALAEVVRRFFTPPTSCPGPQACADHPASLPLRAE